METIRYHTKEGNVHGLLVKEARKRAYIVMMQPPIHLRAVPLTETKYMSTIDVPINRAKKHLRRAAMLWGNQLSKSTKDALRTK